MQHLWMMLSLFLLAVIIFPTIGANADSMPKWIWEITVMWTEKKITDKEFSNALQYLSDKKIYTISEPNLEHKKFKTESMNYVDKFENQISYVSTNSGIARYFVHAEPVPEWAPYAKNSVSDGIDFWQSQTNIQFNNADVINPSTIFLKWVKEIDGPYAAYVIDRRIIEIGLGDSDCGKWLPYNSKYVSSLIKHELGHVIGLGHSNDQNDIMYPKISFTKYAEGSIQNPDSTC